MINSHPSNYPKQTYAINFGYGPESKYLLKERGRKGGEGRGGEKGGREGKEPWPEQRN